LGTKPPLHRALFASGGLSVWEMPSNKQPGYRHNHAVARPHDPNVPTRRCFRTHFITKLRTVVASLPGYGVSVTDWTNARDVPISAPDFALDDCTDYVIDTIRLLGRACAGRRPGASRAA
jgi:poly(3-hydroxybutyrate) depolymerase